jgi:anti-sigma regulatory factor (Ser/Thr protein kinase)
MVKTFHISPSLEQVVCAIHDIRAFLAKKQLSEKSLFALDLTTEEILTNIIKYSSFEKEITITVSILDNEYELEFHYFGDFFDPTSQKEIDVNQPLLERKIGGLGLGIVKKFAKGMNYTHSDNQNTLTIKIDF